MPKLLPHPIKTDSIAVYGRMIGIRKMKYAIPSLVTVDITPADLGLSTQVLIANSLTPSETISKTEGILLGVGKAPNDSINRAESVGITN